MGSSRCLPLAGQTDQGSCMGESRGWGLAGTREQRTALRVIVAAEITGFVTNQVSGIRRSPVESKMKSFWEGRKDRKTGKVLPAGGCSSCSPRWSSCLRHCRDRQRRAGPSSLDLTDPTRSPQRLSLLTGTGSTDTWAIPSSTDTWAIPSCSRGLIHFR